jgi:hypothetical protein
VTEHAPGPDPGIDRRAFLRKAATAVGAFGLGLLVDEGWARAVRGARLEREGYPRVTVGRYRVHHNVVGWMLLLVGVFAFPWVLLPLGLGMIVGHRRRDRLFWFLERVE